MYRHQVYTLSLIPPDLSHDETITQIADAMDNLDSVVTDMFGKIQTSIGESKNRLQGIIQRITLAQNKINTIRGSQKANRVFSSAKFPVNKEEDKPFTSIFNDAIPAMVNTRYRSNSLLSNAEPKRSDYSTPKKELSLKEKMQFYNVQIYAKNQTNGDWLSIPDDITSVGSLLLFNTSENPYQKRFTMSDPLVGVTRLRYHEANAGPDSNQIGLAPMSMGDKQDKPNDGDNYFYSPGIGIVPQLDVPVDLPHLPGIADNLAYSGDMGPTIAPSVQNSAVDSVLGIPALPVVDFIPELPVITPTPNTGFASGAPPPPPPPPPAFMSVAPPPPPPPPVVQDQILLVEPVPAARTKVPKSGEAKATPPIMSPGGDLDLRASLLESIRQAGGKSQAKLKSIETSKTDIKKRKEAKPVESGGDLMSDLKNKLTMRRRGISGAKDGVAGESEPVVGGAMSRISAMIPPPSPKPRTTISDRSLTASSDNDDGDWD